MKKTNLNRNGAALVELAISVMLLLTLVFGIIEFALIMKDYLAVSQAAREGARSAALRNDTGVAAQVAKDSAAALSADQIAALTVTAHYRIYSPAMQTWSDWSAYTGALPTTAMDGESQVMITVTCPHSTIIGSLFGLPEILTLTGKMVARKE
ncbi:MAG: TadE/TadG family type IV pilus assembly protein [Armatimonadota bacterium]